MLDDYADAIEQAENALALLVLSGDLFERETCVLKLAGAVLADLRERVRAS